MTIKPVICVGSSRDELRAFPAEARERAGLELYLVQRGVEPRDWKPMPSVGAGVREIRVRVGRAFRVLYVTKFADAVYVLHAFEKKTQKTPTRDIELARQRLAELLRIRSEEKRP
ncbi:MAG: type II toxin-antitoxin system RelE/ParE family toxin [Gemmatimonadota bacterium]|nr:type II toxin-antitoxin system RelE/ParE family toxin [Gemmatimonadota bacterium]